MKTLVVHHLETGWVPIIQVILPIYNEEMEV